eukprot:NODE_396_length_9428_cov_0.525137.p1 type:complete len:735 gc:universal NODE_396_length_9428_cov_0.525137:6309-4105(-)
MDIQTKNSARRGSIKLDSAKQDNKAESDVDLLNEMAKTLLLKCIQIQQTSIPPGFDLNDIRISYRELISLAKFNDKFVIPSSWFPAPLQSSQSKLFEKEKIDPLLTNVTATDTDNTPVTTLNDLNVLSVLLDYGKCKNYNLYKICFLSTKDVQLGTFELLLGLLLFNKPLFNIKYVISDKLRLHYGINKKKSIELAEYYSIVPLNNLDDLSTTDIQNTANSTIQEFVDILMSHVVLNKDPFLLKFILIYNFKSNRDWCARQYRLLFCILIEKTVFLLGSLQDAQVESRFNDLINSCNSLLILAINDEMYHDPLLDAFKEWMSLIFQFNFTSQDCAKGFLPLFMLTEISRVQLALFDNNGWECKDAEYRSFISWFIELYNCNTRFIAWSRVLSLLSSEVQNKEQLVNQSLNVINSSTDSKSTNTVISPMGVQYYLNTIFKQVLVEYQLASDISVDLTIKYLQTCDVLLQVEYPWQLNDTYTNTAISSAPNEWIKHSISKLIDLMMKQANEQTTHTLIEMMRPSNSDFNENTLSLFLETLESILIKDWTVRYEAILAYIQPQVFWKKNVDFVILTVFSKIPTIQIQAFGDVFNQSCTCLQRIHAFLERAHSEYCLELKIPDLSWFLTSCLENWISSEMNNMIQIGHSCYLKDAFESISGLTSDGVYSYITFVNRLVDCVLKINVSQLQTKVAHYLITSLSPSFYEICKLYLRNPMNKQSQLQITGIEQDITTVLNH